MVLSRREFVLAGTAIGALMGGGVVLPVGLNWDRDEAGSPTAVTVDFPAVVVAHYASLTDGIPVQFDYPSVGQSNLLIRMGRPVDHGIGPLGDLVGFSNHCTHMGCPIIEFFSEHGVLGPCPCHFTVFDLTRDGLPAIGQATQRLPRILLRVDGDDVVAHGVNRPLYGHADPLHGIGVELLTTT
jgi:arsenite oxidase small subunit